MASVSENSTLLAPPTPAIAEKINKLMLDKQTSSKVAELVEEGERGENLMGKEVSYYQPELENLKRGKYTSVLYEESPAIAEKSNKMMLDKQISSKVAEFVEGGERGENLMGKEVSYYQPEMENLKRGKYTSVLYDETSDHLIGVEKSSTVGIDLNVTPKIRSQRKKHRPKVFKEGKSLRKPRTVTHPSDIDEKSRCKDTLCKNKYVRRNKDVTNSSDLENISCKRKYVQRVKDVTHFSEIDMKASGDIIDEEIMLKAKSLRRRLNFDLEEPQALDDFSAAMPMLKIVFGAHGIDVYDEGVLTSWNVKEAVDSTMVQDQVAMKTSAEGTSDPNNSTYQSKNECLQQILMPSTKVKKITRAEKISSFKSSVKYFKALARKAACFDSTPVKQPMQKNKNSIQPSTPEKLSKFSCAFESEIWVNQAHQETSEDINMFSKKARCHLRYPRLSSTKYIYVEEHEGAYWNVISSAQKKAEIGFLATKSLNVKDLNPETMSEVCQSNNCFNVSAYSFVSSETLAPFIDQVDYIVQKLRHLNISRCHEFDSFQPQNAVVPYGEHEFIMVPYDRNIERIKRQRPRAKVDLDPESNRIWNLLMGKDCSEGDKRSDIDQKKWWDEERRVFQGRVESFIARMHLVQGDRRFSQWKGSVVDSVVGVFLTQNVSDHLSSSAFMALAANFPVLSRDKCSLPKGENINIFSKTQNKCIVPFNVSPKLGASLFDNGSLFQHYLDVNISQNGFRKETNNYSETLGSISNSNITYYSRKKAKAKSSDLCKREVILCQESIDSESYINLTEVRDIRLSEDSVRSQNFVVSSKKKVGSSFKAETCKVSQIFSETPTSATKKRKSRPNVEKITYDWEMLRKEICCNKPVQERCSTTLDSVDWDAVRTSDVSKIAQAIRGRGMNNVLAERIKEFLNRVVKEHKSLDLEWLRDAPPNKVKDYLLSIRGLGLKSTECVRLLTLQQLAFPVDTNVGRICVRLGWVPLQPLPESLQLHLLELYPVLATIQKYLWPRLCKLDQKTLYELHYQMITFGKVFCTKRMPNCNSCPMRGECRHFASAFASARLALPAPEEKSVVSLATQLTSERSLGLIINPRLFPQNEGCSNSLECAFKNNCVPIIEEPASPEQSECQQTLESAIEVAFYEDTDEIPTIKLNFKEFKQNLQNYMEENIELQDGSLSKALVALNPEAASIPMPKLKNVSRLRTEHQVYEIPDKHPLLEGLDPREPDDPSPYLLAIWTLGEIAESTEPPKIVCNLQDAKPCERSTCFAGNSTRVAGSHEVLGTLLIPCRTAMRGSFPLNGTYFQVNEVFADHHSSRDPIYVPRDSIWNLPRRIVYFGTSIPTIFRGLTTEVIQQCFWRGFVCVRGFDRVTRAPKPLYARLHFPASKATKIKNAKEAKVGK